MISNIILIGDISDIDVIPENLFHEENTKIFAFNFDVHERLKTKGIHHEIADGLLNQEERLKLFDKGSNFLSWYSKISSNDLKFESVNLLKIFDSHEFLSYLMPILIQIVIIKKIVVKENPSKIIGTSFFSGIINSVIKSDNIETQFFQNKVEKKLLWDKITVKYNFGSLPLTFNFSKKNYFRIKNSLENALNFFSDILFNLNSAKKKGIIFLEFNPQLFSKFFQLMKNYDGDIILVNQRRSAVWSKKSIDVIKKSKCKILKPDSVLNKEEKNEISLLVNKYSIKFEKLWKNSNFFNDVFQINGCIFWNVIKQVIMKIYSEKLFSHILLIRSIKKISKSIEIKCLVSLNEAGETEKTFLKFYKNKIPSILLEHGFIERIEKTKRFDIFSGNSSFQDRTAVWGESKKQWIINEYNFEATKILVSGSPRHDDYFHSISPKSNKKEKILLLAPNPINDVNGISGTDIKLRFNEIIKNVFSIIKKFNDVKIIVKLHPIQLKHNDEIKSLIRKLDSTIPIYLWTSVIDTINSADAVMVLSPEIHATPTILLESMILKKPTMNVYFDEEIPQYEHVKNNAVLTISHNSDLEKNLKKILFDEKFQNELRMNADDFVKKFMDNHGNASEKFASILQSY